MLHSGPNYEALVTKRVDGSNVFTTYWYSSGFVCQFWSAGIKRLEVLSSSLPSLNEWHDVAVVVDRDSAANCKVYLDGEDITTGTPIVTGFDMNLATPWTVGAYASGANWWHDGPIAQFRFWKGVALSESQVQSLINGGQGYLHSELEDAGLPVEYLQGSWDFNHYRSTSDTSSLSPDSSGKGNHLSPFSYGTGVYPGSYPGPTKDRVADRTANGNDGKLIGFDSAWGAWKADCPKRQDGRELDLL